MTILKGMVLTFTVHPASSGQGAIPSKVLPSAEFSIAYFRSFDILF